jgi:hypothetical protein
MVFKMAFSKKDSLTTRFFHREVFFESDLGRVDPLAG